MVRTHNLWQCASQFTRRLFYLLHGTHGVDINGFKMACISRRSQSGDACVAFERDVRTMYSLALQGCASQQVDRRKDAVYLFNKMYPVFWGNSLWSFGWKGKGYARALWSWLWWRARRLDPCKGSTWAICRQFKFIFTVQTNLSMILHESQDDDKVNYITVWSDEARQRFVERMERKESLLHFLGGRIDSLERFEQWLTYQMHSSPTLSYPAIYDSLRTFSINSSSCPYSLSELDSIREVRFIFRNHRDLPSKLINK